MQAYHNSLGVGHKRRRVSLPHSPGILQGSPLAVGLPFSEAHLMSAQSISQVPVLGLCSACGSSREQHLLAPTPVIASPVAASPLQSARFMGAQAVPADAFISNIDGVASETGLFQGGCMWQGKTTQSWVPLHAIVQGTYGGPNAEQKQVDLPARSLTGSAACKRVTVCTDMDKFVHVQSGFCYLSPKSRCTSNSRHAQAYNVSQN